MTDDLLHDLLTAERGSRELDARFALALGAPQEYFDSFDTDFDGFPFEGFAEVEGPECYFDAATWGGGGRSWTAPHYTTNMQDTIEAVPEGWELQINISKKGSVVCMCPDWNDDDAPVFWSNEPDESERGKFYKRRIGRHATPQLALSAAILKAKGAQDGS